jgi:ABC-type multidrug transport system fused ATPase/permease subunit
MGYQKPKNFFGTLRRVLGYMKGSGGLLLLIGTALLVSSLTGVAGSVFLQPMLDNYILPGDFAGLARMLLLLAGIYLLGIGSGATMNQLVVRLAQRTIHALRQELFDKMQNLPLRYFDANTHGNLMSRYTNDTDNVQLMLEQGGVNVSGGQKQRLCIARAMLKKPALLILDDSTSAVDTATEAGIRAAFREMKRTTVLIVAQRISSVRDADKIIVLEGGKISGMGKHDELFETNEIYREICVSQNVTKEGGLA